MHPITYCASITGDAYVVRECLIMIHPSDIHTLTDFKRHSAELLGLMEESGRPQVLTVEGRPKAVLLAIETFEKLSQLADRAAAVEGIRRGLADLDGGRTMGLDELEAALRQRMGLGART